MSDRQADAQAGQRARFGQGLHNQQIRVAMDQSDCRSAAEVDIGFIDHNDGIPIALQQPLHVRQRQQTAGRGVGIGEDHAAIRAQIIGDAQGKVFGQRNRDEVDAVQAAVDRVEAVGDVREQQRRGVLE